MAELMVQDFLPPVVTPDLEFLSITEVHNSDTSVRQSKPDIAVNEGVPNELDMEIVKEGIRKLTQLLDIRGIVTKAEKAEKLATKVHLTPAMSANVYRTTVNARLKCKKDKAGPSCLDNTFLEHFNHGLVTNQLKKTLRNTNEEANEGSEKIATITGCLPPSEAEGDYEKKGLGFPICSTKVPKTTLKDASVTCEHSVSHEITKMKDLKTNNFKDSPTKSNDAEHPDEPIQLAYTNKRTFAKIFGTAFEGRLRIKQDGAGSGCQDDTVPQLSDYGYVTNGWEELLRRTVTVPKWLPLAYKTRCRSGTAASARRRVPGSQFVR